MKGWQERVITENLNLNTKIRKLIGLLLDDGVDDRIPSKIDQNLLAIQLRIMIKYSEILTKRIAGF